MEMKQTRSRIGKKSTHKECVVGILVSSSGFGSPYEHSQKAILADPSTQYQLLPSPSKRYSKFRHSRVGAVFARMIKLGESVDILARRIREHVKLGPKLSETVKGKLSLGARILQVGGVANVFKQNFNIRDDEKLLKAFQCYLSTTAGPIAGLLFLSDHRIAFCSERSIKVSSPTGKLLRAQYKVSIPLKKIKRAIESEDAIKPTQKYVQLLTEDNFEFWFMGFLNHQRTLKYIQQTIHQVR
ncbi:putative GEM-like protein 8 [Andrographis paniculata]|uniref:putative GEM-like protein 8 n=1 Tax=Andrographis paniculata TaxID=175694 RepID=UPI0021E7DA0F|nr:putative GEM-like protein 8 [Andrographis paniculata]